MKTAGVTRKKSRKYESPLREKQAEGTRRLIIEALIDQLATSGMKDFSIPHVAERAGVTTRTVYRYYPTKEALLAAVDDEVVRRFKDLPSPDTLDDVPTFVDSMFESFEQGPQLIRALVRAGANDDAAAVRARGRKRRFETLRAAIDREVPGMDPRRRHASAAMIHWIFSAASWDALRTVWELSEEEAKDIVEWALRTLIDDIRKQAPARRKRA